MTTQSEAEYIRQATRGDSRAFEQWCKCIEKSLYGYGLGMVRNPQDAEDIAQEALVRVFGVVQKGQLRGGAASARSLAFAVAHNLAIDVLRKRNRPTPTKPETKSNGHHPAAASLVRDEVARAMEDLPDQHRAALMLRVYGELSYSAIAETLDATFSEVKTWIYRGRKRLAELLDHDGQYIGAKSREM